jgi:hypothetical protein
MSTGGSSTSTASRAPASSNTFGSVRLRTVVLCLLLSACARVAPYERGTLARSDMELGENPDLAAGEEHGLAYREGSSGGGAAKGGGCGCN